MTFEVHSKNFIVTGGASGMGAVHVANYLKQGAKVAIVDIAVGPGKELAERLNITYPGNVIFVKCDISKEHEIERAFAEVMKSFKRVDVIINNAGIMVDSPEMWRTASDVNWQGVVSFTLKGIKHMSKEEGGVGGVIVNIASTAALLYNTLFCHSMPIYCGSKSAVMHFCRCIALDPFYAKTGIKILCICFGATDTPLLNKMESRARDPKMGKGLVEYATTKMGIYQKSESAVAAVDYIVKNAPNGTLWLSSDDKPAKDITSVVDSAFATFRQAIVDNAE